MLYKDFKITSTEPFAQYLHNGYIFPTNLTAKELAKYLLSIYKDVEDIKWKHVYYKDIDDTNWDDFFSLKSLSSDDPYSERLAKIQNQTVKYFTVNDNTHPLQHSTINPDDPTTLQEPYLFSFIVDSCFKYEIYLIPQEKVEEVSHSSNGRYKSYIIDFPLTATDEQIGHYLLTYYGRLFQHKMDIETLSNCKRVEYEGWVD